ncbi:hypothetical protein C7974DRAFT_366495 [Boeremia exigua]|uniref:uncharacterized protein n=1 Tax=Boeremia exigua TaxID=749465 RepID=UPI001E8C9E47|nr:uncharacterized protein C7974DRAFT_366495 [Boeremia exigua]KAH6616836.1 hypothetical protein C7974DRAFT_366495 [Boeremia exigua]
MPVFLGNRPIGGSSEYTAVKHDEHSSDEISTYQPCEHTIEESPTTTGQISSNVEETKTSDHQECGSSERSREEAGGRSIVSTIAGWPQSPCRLDRFSVPLLVGDVLLILLPVAFLVLAITAWRLDGEPLSKTVLTVERAMTLGPTVFPLAFAAIGSRCLRGVAIYLAERGTSITTGARLLGSQSVVSAVGTAFTLRSVNLITIALLLLWALSPLGGQSSLRLLIESNKTMSHTGTVYYSDPAATMDLDESWNWFSLIPTVLGASLAVSEDVKSRPVDLWGHPKIPRVDLIEQNARSKVDIEGEWIPVNTTDRTYPSWTGINVQGIFPDMHATFQVKANYLVLDCEKLFGGNSSAVVTYLQDPNISMYPNLWPRNPDNYTLEELEKDASRNPPKSFIQIHSCTPKIVTVDARVECQSGDCEVTQVRSSPSAPNSVCHTGLETTLACLEKGTIGLHKFLNYFPKAVSVGSLATSMNPYDDFIGGANVTYRNSRTDYTRDLRQIPDKTISDRLTTVLNTYWQAGAWGLQVMRAGLFDLPVYPWNGSENEPERFVNVTEATFTSQVVVYRANVGWVAYLVLIATILLLLAVGNVTVSALTVAPDLFYYASSLARENPYTNTPDGGTGLDGAKRSRLLKNMKVQIADVSPDHDIG